MRADDLPGLVIFLLYKCAKVGSLIPSLEIQNIHTHLTHPGKIPGDALGVKRILSALQHKSLFDRQHNVELRISTLRTLVKKNPCRHDPVVNNMTEHDIHSCY